MTEDRTLTKKEVEQIKKEANTPGITHQATAVKWKIDISHVKWLAKRGKELKNETK